MRTKIIIGVVIVVIAAAFVFWGRSCSTDTSQESITIAQFGDFFLYAPLYVAIDQGYFEKHGLDVSLVSTGGDDKTWAAVISGAAAFGVSDPTFVPIADSRGQPGRVVATLVNGVPFWGVTLDTSIEPITDPKALEGHIVATFPSPSTAYTLQRRMFEQADLKPQIREGAFGTLMAMLRSKQADIALELEPNVSQAVSQGAKVLYSLQQVYGEFAITGLTTTPDLIQERPELVEKVVCSLEMALDFIASDPEGALKILRARFPEVSPDVARSALARAANEGVIPRNVVTEDNAWAKAVQLRVDVGDLKAPKPMSAYVDNTFAKRAKSGCQHPR